MANNRLYIRCKECGATLCLAKSLGYSYYTHCENEKDYKNYVERLEDFFEEHSYCYELEREEKIEKVNYYYPKINIKEEVLTGNNFDICYESENIL